MHLLDSNVAYKFPHNISTWNVLLFQCCYVTKSTRVMVASRRLLLDLVCITDGTSFWSRGLWSTFFTVALPYFNDAVSLFWRVWSSFSCATPCLSNKVIFKTCSLVHWGMLRSSVFAFNLPAHLLCHAHMGQRSMLMHLIQCLRFLKGTLKSSSTHSQALDTVKSAVP